MKPIFSLFISALVLANGYSQVFNILPSVNGTVGSVTTTTTTTTITNGVGNTTTTYTTNTRPNNNQVSVNGVTFSAGSPGSGYDNGYNNNNNYNYNNNGRNNYYNNNGYNNNGYYGNSYNNNGYNNNNGYYNNNNYNGNNTYSYNGYSNTYSSNSTNSDGYGSTVVMDDGRGGQTVIMNSVDSAYTNASRMIKDRINNHTVHFTGLVISDNFWENNLSKIYVDDQYSDFMKPGKYERIGNYLYNSIKYTFDGIAVPPNTRLIIYSGANYTGNILVDVTGPAIINNSKWEYDNRYMDANSKTYTSDLQPTFPQATRMWSVSDMHTWSNGSMEIIAQ